MTWSYVSDEHLDDAATERRLRLATRRQLAEARVTIDRLLDRVIVVTDRADSAEARYVTTTAEELNEARQEADVIAARNAVLREALRRSEQNLALIREVNRALRAKMGDPAAGAINDTFAALERAAGEKYEWKGIVDWERRMLIALRAALPDDTITMTARFAAELTDEFK